MCLDLEADARVLLNGVIVIVTRVLFLTTGRITAAHGRFSGILPYGTSVHPN